MGGKESEAAMSKFSYYEISAGQLIEFQRILAEAGFTPKEVDSIIKEPALAKKMLEAIQVAQPDRYPQYAKFLYSLEKQKVELKHINGQMARKKQVPKLFFDKINTDDGGHIQMGESLNYIYIESSESLEETFDFNLEIIRITQPNIYPPDFAKDTKHLVRHQKARKYKPGAHVININLFANWAPDEGRSVRQLRKSPLETGVWFGAIEPIGAYGSQDPLLLQSQDGVSHPYQDQAGLIQVSGVALDRVPCFHWYSDLSKVFFDSCDADFVDHEYAASLVRDVLSA